MATNINITSTDVDALARVAYAEADNVFTYYKGRGYSDADAAAMSYGMVIDIIINRYAAGSSTIYGSSIQGIIDKNDNTTWQFDAVRVAGGSWTDIAPVSSGTLSLVENYLAARTSGVASIVGKASDYLNPTAPGTSPAWLGWGQQMKNMEFFGVNPFNSDGTLKSNVITHITGNANNLRPDPYTITYDGNTSPEFKYGHDHQPPFLAISEGPGAVDLSCPLPTVITSDIQPCFNSAISAASPLVIDLSSSHTGVTLTTWNASTTDTFFDLNANGFAVQTAWVSGDTGLLARDLNSNGLIDSSAELFGSPTVDGFAKLAALDSNHDLRIDNNDADWSTLVVWTDDNGDAVTQSGELHSLASLGIASIDLAGVAASTSTISGNPISHTSKVTFTGGATATIADAWFIHDNTNSYYAGDYTLNVETLFLPTLRGYGTLPDLTIAMSQDSDLKDMVADLVAGFDLSDLGAARDAVTDILYRWAGVEGIVAGSRGTYIDAQHLEFLENFIGSEFGQWGYYPDPYADASAYLETAFQKVLDMVSAALFVQIDSSTLFDTPASYNPATGELEGEFNLSHAAVTGLASIAPSSSLDNEEFWLFIAKFLDSTKGLANLTVTESGWLDGAVTTSNASLDWADVLTGYNASTNNAAGSTINGTSADETLSGGIYNDTIHGYQGADAIYGGYGNDVLYGDDGNDIIYGDDGSDRIYGGGGNDFLYGGDGNDQLYGEYGDDTLSGGAGGNYLQARTGNDTFIYGGGNDVIDDYGGADSIVLPVGIVLGDLSFTRMSTNNSNAYFNDLLITVNGAGSIQIMNEYSIYGGLGSGSIETIVFSDSSTLDLTTIDNPIVYLTSGNDSFSSNMTGALTVYGGDGDDYIYNYQNYPHTFYGGGGNDTLRGGAGADTYIASTGFDIIQENAGTDTIVVPEGFTIDDVTFYRVNNTSGPTNDLGIIITGLGQIDVQGHFGWYPVEYIHFNEDNSTFSLTNLSITTVGTADNDSLYPPSMNVGANDIIDGREGNDYLAGGSGDDTYIFSAGHDTIYDDGGDDTIIVRDNYNPEDITISWNYDVSNAANNRGIFLTDSDGNTVVVQNQSYSSSYGVEHIAFADGTTWHLSSMELATYGTSGNDGLDGHDVGDGSSADTIYGYGGNDTINGGNGDDLIYGGDGDDYLLGNAGNDIIYGGDGADNVYAASNDGNDIVHGGDGNDLLRGADHSILYGDSGADTLINNASGAYASSTAVTMNGGAGADTLQGGAGVDTFVFDAATAFDAVDTITNFDKAGTYKDKLDISDILDGHYDPLTQLITDFVQITTNGSNSELYVDTTGTATFGTAQHIATIQGVTGLTDEEALVTAGTLLAA